MMRRSSRTPSQRQLRVAEEIRHALAWVLERGELHDPALQSTTITITEVQMSPDLRHATVYTLPAQDAPGEAILASLERARGYLRRRVGETVTLRYVPDLTFRSDTSLDQASRIDDLLRSPAVVRDLASGADDDASAFEDPEGTRTDRGEETDER